MDDIHLLTVGNADIVTSKRCIAGCREAMCAQHCRCRCYSNQSPIAQTCPQSGWCHLAAKQPCHEVHVTTWLGWLSVQREAILPWTTTRRENFQEQIRHMMLDVWCWMARKQRQRGQRYCILGMHNAALHTEYTLMDDVHLLTARHFRYELVSSNVYFFWRCNNNTWLLIFRQCVI